MSDKKTDDAPETDRIVQPEDLEGLVEGAVEEEGAALTPRVSTPAPARVTLPTAQTRQDTRREPTWEPVQAEEAGPRTRRGEGLSAPRIPRELGFVPEPTSGPQVLIVDDDADIREGLKSILEEEGIRVAEAVNGVEGLRRLFSMWPRVDLVLLDLMMPKMNGLDFLSVQQVSQASDVPVIVISGNPKANFAELDDSFVFLRKGDFGDIEALLSTIRRHINEGRDRRGLRLRP